MRARTGPCSHRLLRGRWTQASSGRRRQHSRARVRLAVRGWRSIHVKIGHYGLAPLAGACSRHGKARDAERLVGER